MDLDDSPLQPLGPILRKRSLGSPDPASSSADHPRDGSLAPRPMKQLRLTDRSTKTATPSHVVPAHAALSFDAVRLLQDIAYTQLHVTVNFANFNPFESIVLLYVTRTLGDGYRLLW